MNDHKTHHNLPDGAISLRELPDLLRELEIAYMDRNVLRIDEINKRLAGVNATSIERDGKVYIESLRR